MMFDPDLKCGVLTDFDLSVLQWEPRVIGTDRTGTVPFMATELLTEAYWRGLTKRFYRHELEALIWILPYTFLLYQDGMRRPNTYVDAWRTSDYNICREKKVDFQEESTFTAAASTVQTDFAEFWELVYFLFRALSKAKTSRQDHAHRTRRKTSLPSTVEPRESGEMWDLFVSALDEYAGEIAEQYRTKFCALVARLKMQQPYFIEITAEELAVLREKYL